MFKKFINWQKNIQPTIIYCGLSVVFDKHSISFETLEKEMLNLVPYLSDEILKERLKSEKLSREKTNSRRTLFCDFNYPIDDRSFISRNFGIYEINRYKYSIMERLGVTFKMDSCSGLLIQNLIATKGFKLLILYNPYFKRWENNHSKGSYKYRGGLKIYYDTTFKMEKIDLSKRPGRMTVLEHFTYLGGSDYWFGTDYFDIISKKQLLAFKEADLVEELQNGIVHIKLFEMEEYWTEKSQNRLWALREYLKIDQLEEEYQRRKRQHYLTLKSKGV